MKKETMVITRKFVLRPVASERKEWVKKIKNYVLEDSNRKLEYYQNKKAKDDTAKNRIESLKQLIADAEQELISQKMINDYAYHLVREAMESEARRKNYILTWAFSQMIEHGVQFMDYKEQCKFIREMIKPAYRQKGSKGGSAFDSVEIDNILKGYGTSFSQAFTSKLIDCVKNGLLDGKITLPTYKLDSPFSVAKSHISISHDYDTYEELERRIGCPGVKIYFNYGGNAKPTIAKFLIDTGTSKNKEELNTTLLRLVSGEYKLCGSTIGLCKDGKKIVLNLSMEIPVKEIELDEDVVVGVDIGLAIPAYCALNTNTYVKKQIGSADDFLRVRTQLQSQYRRLQKQLTSGKGGHGRKKKMQAMNKFQDKERNFVKTYNHFVSHAVVDFAVKNKAKYINLENLSGYNGDDRILRNWSYFELQKFIEYKAAKYGIEVRYINPYHTSQICSCCGHWEIGQRTDQAHFVCKKCGTKLNADYNAAKNIAMNTDFQKTVAA